MFTVCTPGMRVIGVLDSVINGTGKFNGVSVNSLTRILYARTNTRRTEGDHNLRDL